VGNALKAAAFLAVILALPLLSASCSRVETGMEPHGRAGEPGVVRIVGIGSMNSLIPTLAGTDSATDIGQFWAAWLYRVDDRGDLEPELATNVPSRANGQISADGLRITYELRRGVTWSDGAPFTAQDVIFSWRAIMNPNNDVLTRSGYDQIDSMTAPDPHTVVVSLKRPYAPAVATFFGPSLAPMSLLPAHLLAGLHDINHAAYDVMPVGIGPFVVTGYDPETRVVLKPNPRYWRGAPKLREIDVLMVPDANTREVMMRTGEADLYYDPPSSEVDALRTLAGIHVDDITFNEEWYIEFNEARAPLDDVRVRRAIAEGIDRDYVIKAVMNGNATPAISDQPPYSWAYNPNVRQVPFDPVAGAAQLQSAGWKLGSDGYRYRAGRRLSLVYISSLGYGDARRYGPVFQAAMKKIGVDVDVKFVPTSILYAAKADGGIIENGRFDVAFAGWVGGIDPDDAAQWECDQIPPNGDNDSFSCDPRIDAQERLALESYDQNARKAAYWRIQELLAQDVPVLFICWSKRDDARSERLLNYKPAPAVTEFWNSWEWQI
jgi:peptide/nickel transport system substrate-binding protein